MVSGETYSEEYYHFSRPESGAKGFVDKVRDGYIRRQILRRVPKGRLLDVGCGLGLFLETMRNEFAPHGIDLSPYAIDQAQRRIPEATLAVGSLTDGLAFDEPFDAVTAINIFEHLEDPGVGLDAVRSVLRPGGLLVAHLPTIGNRLQAKLYAGSYAADPTHIYRPSGREFCALAEGCGFATVTYSFAPFVGGPLWRALPWHPAFLGVFKAV